MQRRAVLLLLLACLATAALQKRKQQDQMRIEVVEAKAERAEGKITLDGQVKNTGQKVIHNLILFFDLLDSEQRAVSRRKGSIDEEVLEPGQEAAFHFYVSDHARAVEFRMAAESPRTGELDVVKPGPFPIE
jgi:hypothetical protein